MESDIEGIVRPLERMMIRKPRSIVAALGAVIYALSGLRVLWASVASDLIVGRQFDFDLADFAGSGGIGAVYVGVDVFVLWYAVLALSSIAVNRLLATWARGSDRNVTRLYRVQGWSIVVSFALLAASVIVFNVRPGPLPFMLFPLSGAFWGVQFLLTSALLGTYARS